MNASPETIERIWTISLALYGVVLVVVAVLLILILREAQRIHAGVSEIWNVGQKIANNTIHIALLGATNHAAGRILEAAKRVVTGTTAVKTHAETCPGCPACVLGRLPAQTRGRS